jgi:hypothetical protein
MKHFFLIVLFLLSISIPSQAIVRYVKENGNGSQDLLGASRDCIPPSEHWLRQSDDVAAGEIFMS